MSSKTLGILIALSITLSSCITNQETDTVITAGTPDSIRSFNGTVISKSKMDAFIKHQMDSLEMPGLSIAFINDDELVYHNALGVKNKDTEEKVDDSTLFDAASMSKTVFSFL